METPLQTPHPRDEAETADREAIEWVLALREAPDDMEIRDSFEAWLARSSANAKAWAELAGVYELIGHAPATHVHALPGLRRRRALPQVRAQSRTPKRRAVVRNAGLAAAGLVATLLLAQHVRPSLESDHRTGKGEIKVVALDDGSRVTLAPESAIDVTYRPGLRKVTLLHGAAWFDVARNAERPFKVHSGATQTTVLGTAFEVRRQRDGAWVAVEHGRVRVDPPGARIAELGAGDVVRATDIGALEASHLPPAHAASWRSGRLIAYDRPTGEVIDIIRTYYRGAIIIRGAELERRRITGVFDLTRPAQALQAVAQTHGDSVVRIGPWLIVISLSSEAPAGTA